MLVEKARHKDTAWKHRVNEHLVSKLVRSFQKDSSFVDALRQKELSKTRKLRSVIDAADDILNTKKNIWRSK